MQAFDFVSIEGTYTVIPFDKVIGITVDKEIVDIYTVGRWASGHKDALMIQVELFKKYLKEKQI